MKVAFLCSTPYQIFTAINITCNHLTDSQVDVYVYDYFERSEEMVNSLKESGTFRNVNHCRFKEIHRKLVNGTAMSRIKNKIHYFLFHKSGAVGESGCGNESYDTVFYSNQDPVNEMMIRLFHRRNRSVSICHFEDGWIDYTVRKHEFFGTRAQRSNWFWKTPKEYFERTVSWLYLPELADSSVDPNSIRKIQSGGEKASAAINAVFGYSLESRINTKVLYFDTLQENYLGGSMEQHLNTLQILSEMIDIKEITIKKHPRNFSKEYITHGYQIYSGLSVPFEVVCANQDFGKNLLISTFSTACFSPKVLFDQEPYVILTYKMLGYEAQMKESIEQYICRIRNSYRNPERIIIPEDRAQFEMEVEKCRKRWNGEL